MLRSVIIAVSYQIYLDKSFSVMRREAEGDGSGVR